MKMNSLTDQDALPVIELAGRSLPLSDNLRRAEAIYEKVRVSGMNDEELREILAMDRRHSQARYYCRTVSMKAVSFLFLGWSAWVCISLASAAFGLLFAFAMVALTFKLASSGKLERCVAISSGEDNERPSPVEVRNEEAAYRLPTPSQQAA